MPGKKYYFWQTASSHHLKFTKLFLVVIFVLFLFRVGQLQIISGSYYFQRAEGNRLEYFRIPAPRGRIFDRNGLILAGNQPDYSLFISPAAFSSGEKEGIALRIEALIGRPKEKLLNKFKTSGMHPFGVVKLASHLKRDEIIKIEENIHYLPGVFIQVEPIRDYVFADTGSHLLGYTREISSGELKLLRVYGYKLKDRIGKAGLEKVYDGVLRGRDGYRKVEVSAMGRHLRLLEEKPPKIGNDILLTIDWDLQIAAKNALGERRGVVVAMNPSSGEILVWLSEPSFNPLTFTLPITPDSAEKIFQDSGHPLFDRTIQGQYAPGSLFKLITAIAALESDFDSQKTYNCSGYIKVGYDRRVFKCWKDSVHGRLNLIDAIAYSCNVHFYQLGMDVGVRNIHNVAVEMGMGINSQDIFEGERIGVIPTPDWKKKNFGVGWYPGDTVNMSIGQGYVLANPLQILKMISLIATEGEIYEPYLVKMAISPDGKIAWQKKPKLTGKSKISGSAFKVIKNAMRKAVEYGTAKYLNLPFDVAGKTGTSANSSREDDAWFGCFSPVENPEIVIVVLVEEGGYGSQAAMPIAREILKKYYESRKSTPKTKDTINSVPSRG